MRPNFEPGKWFAQCVGIDIAKSTFTACLCMYEFDMGCSTAPVVFKNNKTGFNQFVKWSVLVLVPAKSANSDFNIFFIVLLVLDSLSCVILMHSVV